MCVSQKHYKNIYLLFKLIYLNDCKSNEKTNYLNMCLMLQNVLCGELRDVCNT